MERSHNTLDVLSLESFFAERLSDWPIPLERLRKQAPSLQSISIRWLTNNSNKSCQLVMFPSLLIDLVVPDSGGGRWTLKKNFERRKRGFMEWVMKDHE